VSCCVTFLPKICSHITVFSFWISCWLCDILNVHQHFSVESVSPKWEEKKQYIPCKNGGKPSFCFSKFRYFANCNVVSGRYVKILRQRMETRSRKEDITGLQPDSSACEKLHLAQRNGHRIIELFRLEKSFKIMKSNHKSNTAKSITKLHP